MARRLRIQHAGGWYHVINRGVARQGLYGDDRDSEHFVGLLSEMSARYGVEVHGYVLMWNHYHLIVRVRDCNLSQCLQWLNVSYSVWFNRRHTLVGPVFQGRFQSVPVEGGMWLYALSQYIHLNPVRVKWLGLDKRGRRLEGLGLKCAQNAEEAAARLAVLRGHRWSTYWFYAGYGTGPEWLKTDEILGRAGGDDDKERKRHYREKLEAYVRGGYEEGWASRVRSRLAVGADEFIQGVKRSVGSIGREWPGKRELRQRVGFDEVKNAVAEVKGENWSEFVDRHGDWGRDLALTAAREVTGMTLRELGAAVGSMDYAAVGAAVRCFSLRLKKSSECRAEYRRVLELLHL